MRGCFRSTCVDTKPDPNATFAGRPVSFGRFRRVL